MVKIPSAQNITGPASMRGGGPMASVDSSALTRGRMQVARGLEAAAQGIERFGAYAEDIVQRDRKRQIVSDIAKAEALWTKGSLDLGNQFATDGDWKTFNDRATKQTEDLKQAAAALIRDPAAREGFLADTEKRRLVTVDAINDHARDLSQEEDRVTFGVALGESAKLISDPAIGDVARKKAKDDIAKSIMYAQETGLIRPGEAQTLREKYLDGAEVDLAINRATLAGQVDPDGVIKALGFPEPGKTGEVAPEYQALNAEQRLKLADQMRVESSRQQVDKRATIAVAVQNAPVAITNTGTYSGVMPTEADFIDAYGERDGPAEYDQFETAIDVAGKAFGMRTMTGEEIAAMVEAAVPTSSGDDALLESKAYEALSSAAQHVMEARAKDPAGFVMSTFPNVAAAWEDIGNDPAKFAAALTAMEEAQKQLGIEDMALLPKGMAQQAVSIFNDPQRPEAERIGAITGLVMGTQDEDQQEAIAQQLMDEKLPGHVRGALYALARGDQGAANYLFRAALVDPEKLKVPDSGSGGSNTPAQIETRIQEMVFDTDQVGDVALGVSDGTADNFTRVAEDMALIKRTVQLRLIDGSATNVDDAVRMAMKDLYGDVKVVTGQGWSNDANVRIVVPSDQNEAPLRNGFDALLPTVGAAITDDLSAALTGLPTSAGEAQIAAAARDNRVQTILDAGYFASSGEDFVFVDGETGQAVPGFNGEPLVFTREQVIAAGVTQEGAAGIRFGMQAVAP